MGEAVDGEAALTRSGPADLNQILADTLVVARNELKYVADTVADFEGRRRFDHSVVAPR